MINKVILLGNLGKDPEVRSLTDSKVATFTLATSEKFKDRSGNKQESTEWHNIEVWGKLAEVAEKYLKKGDRIYLEGKIKTESWEKDGVTKYMTKIRVNTFQMLSSPPQGQNMSPQEVSAASVAQANQQAMDSLVEGGDDDLPF